MKEKNNKKINIIRYIELIIGVFLLAIAFNLFFSPNDIVYGGIPGLAIVLRKFFTFDLTVFLLICYVICLGLSFIFLGKTKTMYSVLGSLLFPIFAKLTSGIGNFIIINNDDLLLIALFGSLIYGLGNGLIFKAGFTTGGTDILNQILSKYAKISTGMSMLIIDGLIVLAGAFIFGWTQFMYAIIVLYIISFLTDKVLLGISTSKAFYIITTEEDKISDFVINELGHSVTVFDAKGGFTNKKNAVLFTVIPTKEYYKFKEGIHLIDNNAFFTVIDSYEVLGGE